MWRSARTCALLPVLILAGHSAFAEPATPKRSTPITFPLVFTAEEQLNRFGLALQGGGLEQNSLAHRCYDYGEGGVVISVSTERLLRYRQRGFMLNSLCLGLVSETKFDPDSGRRIPTYIYGRPGTAAPPPQPSKSKKETGAGIQFLVTDERPLELPDCFRRGLPLLDCTFNFDRMTGKRLSSQMTRALREIGLAIDQKMRFALKHGHVCDPSGCVERDFGGRLVPEGDIYTLLHKTFGDQVVDRLGDTEIAHARFFDVSLNLPGGYGYALDASGEAGGSLSVAVVKTALDGKGVAPQIDPAEIARMIEKPPSPAQPATKAAAQPSRKK
jgi:hypothetical protein